jgi:exonuclease VII small subunit
MADNFKLQAMGITGLTIDGSSSAPSQTEFSQFLNDGVFDVTNKHLKIKPSDDHLFLAVSSEQSSNGLDINGAKINSVIRESGTDDDWRDCPKIDPSKQGQAVKSGSLHFATRHNPVYTVLDNGIFVFPSPGGDSNTFKVYYVNNSPAETDGTALDHASTGIKYFPNDKVYLVILYASIKSLQSSLSSINISTFSLSAGTPIVTPSAPSISGGSVAAVGIDSLPSAPSYTPPTVGGASESLTATISTGNTKTDFSDWFEVLGDMIQTDEDTELAGAQVQKISTYLQSYQAALQDALNTFNEANVVYQASIQRNLQQAQINMQDAQKEADLTLQAAIQDYTLELQRVSTDTSKYQSLVGAEVQTYQQEITEKSSEYQWMTARLQDLKNEYNQAFASASQGRRQ